MSIANHLICFGQFSPHSAQGKTSQEKRVENCSQRKEKKKIDHDDAFQLGLEQIWSNNVRTLLSLPSAMLQNDRDRSICRERERERENGSDYFLLSCLRHFVALRAVGQSGSNKVLQLLQALYGEIYENHVERRIYAQVDIRSRNKRTKRYLERLKEILKL